MKFTIERLENGLYKIDTGDEAYVGGAASTAIALNFLLFRAEAQGVDMSVLEQTYKRLRATLTA